MNIQPALDQINCAAARLRRNPEDAEMEWFEAGGDALTIVATFPDGLVLEGYAPKGMIDMRAGIEAAKHMRRNELTLIDGGLS